MILILLLCALVTLVTIPVQAYRGKGYRGLYLGIALAALVPGFGCNMMIGHTIDPSTVDARTLQGLMIIHDFGPPFVVWMGCVCMGGLIGAAIWRTPSPPAA